MTTFCLFVLRKVILWSQSWTETYSNPPASTVVEDAHQYAGLFTDFFNIFFHIIKEYEAVVGGLGL